MLRAMNKVQKDQSKRQQPLPHSPSDSCFFPSNDVKQKARNPSPFTVPGLFVGFSTKGLSDSDAVRSPTSPLDYTSFSNLSSSFLGSPRSGSAGHDGKPRCWDCSRVGLGLVDTLSDENKPCGKPLGLSGSRNILFGPQMRINISSLIDDDSFAAAPKSLPKDYAMSSRIQNGASRPLPSSSRMSLQSKGAESEHRAFCLPRSCSAEISRSSSPLTESLVYQNSESDFEVFPSNSKCEMLDSSSSQFVEGSADFDKFSGTGAPRWRRSPASPSPSPPSASRGARLSGRATATEDAAATAAQLGGDVAVAAGG